MFVDEGVLPGVAVDPGPAAGRSSRRRCAGQRPGRVWWGPVGGSARGSAGLRKQSWWTACRRTSAASVISGRVTRSAIRDPLPDPGVPRPTHTWLSSPRSSGTMPGTTDSIVRCRAADGARGRDQPRGFATAGFLVTPGCRTAAEDDVAAAGPESDLPGPGDEPGLRSGISRTGDRAGGDELYGEVWARDG